MPPRPLTKTPREPNVFTLNARFTDAELCRRNDWYPGTRLVGDEGYGPTVIELTAIGRDGILAVTVSHDGKPAEDDYEGSWTLHHRQWCEVPR